MRLGSEQRSLICCMLGHTTVLECFGEDKVIGAPSPPMVAPENTVELFSDITIYVSCLMVLGTAVSKISNTLAELRAMNEEHDRQRREIRMYLTSQSAPFELVSRIMKFVDYRLDRRLAVKGWGHHRVHQSLHHFMDLVSLQVIISQRLEISLLRLRLHRLAIHSFDQSLISKTLQTELYVNQRSPFLVQLPIFALCQAVFADVFADICAVLQKRVFEKKETVFAHGSWATVMEITASGGSLTAVLCPIAGAQRCHGRAQYWHTRRVACSMPGPEARTHSWNPDKCLSLSTAPNGFRRPPSTLHLGSSLQHGGPPNTVQKCPEASEEGLTHSSTLLCKTFAETLSLAGEDARPNQECFLMLLITGCFLLARVFPSMMSTVSQHDVQHCAAQHDVVRTSSRA